MSWRYRNTRKHDKLMKLKINCFAIFLSIMAGCVIVYPIEITRTIVSANKTLLRYGDSKMTTKLSEKAKIH